MFEGLPLTQGSDWFKFFLVIFIGGFMPITASSFLWLRRIKKQSEFARMVALLGIASNEAEFARDRVAEQYAKKDYILPVSFCWFLCILGLTSLLFGSQLVDDHKGRVNFLLTGLFFGSAEDLQTMRVYSMVMLSIGFLGSFFWSVRNIIKRLCAGDLAPQVYFDASTRIIVAPILALMVGHLSVAAGGDVGGNPGLVVVAFLIGFFPDEALHYLRENSPVPMFGKTAAAHDLPLSMIEGMSVYDRTRLEELGIDNAQNLATASFIRLVIRTPYNPSQLIDWIGQARLYVLYKDQVKLLRDNQVRTIFDLVDACSDQESAELIAGLTGLPVAQLLRLSQAAAADPAIKSLTGYRAQLD